jgi:hypothetical protein
MKARTFCFYVTVRLLIDAIICILSRMYVSSYIVVDPRSHAIIYLLVGR